jgi:hypothetical protein
MLYNVPAGLLNVPAGLLNVPAGSLAEDPALYRLKTVIKIYVGFLLALFAAQGPFQEILRGQKNIIRDGLELAFLGWGEMKSS